MTKRDAEVRRASKALSAYFNYELASKLWNKISKTYSEEHWKLMAEAIFNLVPDLLRGEAFYGKLREQVVIAANKYITTPAFFECLNKNLVQAELHWGPTLYKEIFSERLRIFVNNQVRVDQKAMTSQYQMLLGQALQDIAKEEAAKMAAKIKDDGG